MPFFATSRWLLYGTGWRAHFEERIAEQLAGGWQPGYESRFVVAMDVFGWEDDRRRLSALGQVGYVLERVMAERNFFLMQTQAYRSLQRRNLIARLRDPAAPPMMATVWPMAG